MSNSMLRAIIPKADLTAYQRWEMNALDDGAQHGNLLKLPTVLQIERLHQQGHDTGYAAGYQAGSEAGSAAALAAATQLGQLLAALRQELDQFDETIAQSLLALAVDIAKQIVGKALAAQPQLVLAGVRDAMKDFPPFNHHAHLVLHPLDAQLVRTHLRDDMGPSEWKIVEDSTLQRGGCRIHSPAMQVDATLETRWQRVVAAFDKNAKWLASNE